MRGWRHLLLLALVAATPFGAFLLLLVEHPALQAARPAPAAIRGRPRRRPGRADPDARGGTPALTGPPAGTRTGEQPVTRAALRCSFCARVRQDVVAGETPDLCICGDCAQLVLDILAEERPPPSA